VVLVFGGNSGIGLAAARDFAGEGAQVIITRRDAATLAAAQKQIGPDCLAIRSDIADLAALDALYSQVRARHGRIDVLFVNAGVGGFVPAAAVTPEFWDSVHSVNLRGCFFAAQKALPLMGRGGAIVFTGSIGSQLAAPGNVTYAAAKAGLRAVAQFRGRAAAAGHPRQHGEPGCDRNPDPPSQSRHGRQGRGRPAQDDDRQHADEAHGNIGGDRARGAVPVLRRGELHHGH
jgi:NAD(P)-dependent dehydrogenase (short-subunit alcohol dehydrogenase family)